jgi:hypothetical protein
MPDFFLFHYGGRFFRCVALPFGWGRSRLWFTQLMEPMVRALRKKRWRVLVYVDDFLVVPSPVGKVARIRQCSRATRWISGLLSRLGVSRHPTKGEWEGTTRVEHLGFVVDTMEMKFYLAPRKMEKVQSPSDVSAATDSQRETLGRRDGALELPWPMRVSKPSNPLFPVLLAQPIRRSGRKAHAGPTRIQWRNSRNNEPPKPEGPRYLATTGCERGRWETDLAADYG